LLTIGPGRMQSLHATEIRLSDEDLSRHARVVLPRIYATKVELVRAGMLHLEPGTDRTKYEMVDPRLRSDTITFRLDKVFAH
jgi:hypothetical protein